MYRPSVEDPKPAMAGHRNDRGTRGLRQRLASGRACLNCRKRKNRCDGLRPKCGCCRSRGITCTYTEYQLTYNELEALYAEARSRRRDSDILHPEDRRTPSIDQSTEQEGLIGPAQSPSQPDHAVSENTSPSSAEQVNNTTSPARHPIEPLDGTENVEHYSQIPSPVSVTHSDGYFGGSSTFAFVSEVQSTTFPGKTGVTTPRQHKNIQIRTETQSALRHSSLESSHSEPSLSQELPERGLSDDLVDSYFHHVHSLYPFVHESSFRAQYERLWTALPPSPSDSPRPIWFAILNMVYAYGCEFSDAVPRRDLPRTSLPFLTRARTIIVRHIFRLGSLELIQALLLMCHYLQGTLELNECWNMVGLMTRTAVGMGLHLNSSSNGLGCIEREMRRRVWWGCFVVDRTLSMKLGRLPSTNAMEGSEVDLPASVDDQYLTDDCTQPRQPAGRPSKVEFFIQTIKLASIVESVLKDLFQTGACSRGDPASVGLSTESLHIIGHTVSLDGQLLLWWQSVPSHLREPPEIADGSDFQRQRNVLYIRFLNLRLLLHRQAFLIFSRQKLGDPFVEAVAIASARTCASAARETIRLIHTHYKSRLLNSLWYNLHYIFTSLGVLLAVQKLSPERFDDLNLTDNEKDTLEMGMDFLRSASDVSSLAARYVGMLQRVRTRVDEPPSRDPRQTHDEEGHQTSWPNVGPFSQTPLPSTAMSQAWALGGAEDSEDVLAHLDMDFIFLDFDNLLHGTGLPRDFLSTEW